ncbi:acyltransferase [Mediterraneibacter faecis]|uniref:acyltransferase n=1 Tax=Mediterraneibacter faecis TaxID=592978 RepID=UPI0022E808C9|nr:acyltransferase [Mediterraneibacter faecis]
MFANIKIIINFLNLLLNHITIKRKHVECGKNIQIEGKLHIHGSGQIYIGDDVMIISSPNVNPSAGGSSSHFSTGSKGRIIIGNRVGISHLSMTAHQSIIIEDDVLIGSNCMIADTDFHSLIASERGLRSESGAISKPILIKRHAFIGARSIILKGVTIGENSIIGAGSVVTHDVPNDEIWAGNPAKRIGGVLK